MAPFSIDLPVRDQETAVQPPDESLDEQALRAGLAAVLSRLALAGPAGRAGRHEHRSKALGDAMAILDQMVSGPSPLGLGDRGRSVPRELLRVMHLLLQANLSGVDAPLRLAVDALEAIRNSWGLDHAVIDAG